MNRSRIACRRSNCAPIRRANKRRSYNLAHTFKITMRVATIAVLSLLFLASFAQAAASIDADDSLQAHEGEHASDEDLDLIAEESDDESDLSDEEDEDDVSDLDQSEEDIEKLKEKFKWYGNFCGGGYCGGRNVEERSGQCNWNVKPKDSTDRCCLEHDQCCGSTSTRSKECNRSFLRCLKERTNCGWNVVCHHQRAWMKGIFAFKQNTVCGD